MTLDVDVICTAAIFHSSCGSERTGPSFRTVAHIRARIPLLNDNGQISRPPRLLIYSAQRQGAIFAPLAHAQQ